MQDRFVSCRLDTQAKLAEGSASSNHPAQTTYIVFILAHRNHKLLARSYKISAEYPIQSSVSITNVVYTYE